MSDDILPYPFLAMVGQEELKTALILALVNPQVGGVLLIGPYGVGKTTAVRGLIDLMPITEYEDLDEQGQPLKRQERMRIVELPLNARMEDVVGGVNERVALEQRRFIMEEGVLARAHRNLLYIDEVNLLDPRIIDVILDAAAQGRTLVRRGPVTRLFPSQFILVGSMNPEEGALRPQILDRFGLRVWVAPLADSDKRLELYRRVRDFRHDASTFRKRYAVDTAKVSEEIAAAREVLPYVTVAPEAERFALRCVELMHVPSHRAEIALLEAARTRAAADYRAMATIEDVRRCAPMALRQRRSLPIEQYAIGVAEEEAALAEVLARAGTPDPAPEPPTPPRRRSRKT
jgi:magnesium chelatase subunit I